MDKRVLRHHLQEAKQIIDFNQNEFESRDVGVPGHLLRKFYHAGYISRLGKNSYYVTLWLVSDVQLARLKRDVGEYER